MTLNLVDEIIKAVLQLFVAGILGGLVAWFFSRTQKNRELKLQILHNFSQLHSGFISLRFEYNSFYVEGIGKRSAKYHPLNDDEIKQERWKYFQRACGLIGEVQSMKPLIAEVFPHTVDDINFLFGKYQDWRRHIHADKPILQEIDGKNDPSYDDVRNYYNHVVKEMRKKI